MSLLINPYQFGAGGDPGGGGSAYADEVLADSPFAYWRFEETSGTTVADEGETHDGTAVNGPDLNVAGQVGSGITFASASSQYVNVGTLGAFGSQLLAAGFTVEYWAKWTSTDQMVPLGTVNDGTGIILQSKMNRDADDTANRAGGVNFQFRGDGNVFRYRETDRTDLNDGAWHHLVGVWSGSAPDIYVDGVLDNGTPRTSGTMTDKNFEYPMTLGAQNARSTIGRFLDGQMDEVAFYLSPLSSARVAAHYAAATS